MKKNKTLAFMMAATLLVGGTFVGTKALFTDEDQVAGELKISTGDLDIATDVGEWSMVGGRTEINHGTTEDNKDSLQENLAIFDNLKHGDIITKTVTVKNQGTLNANLSLTEDTYKTGSLPAGIDFTAEFENGDGYLETSNGNKVLQPGGTVDIKLQLEVTGGGSHSTGDIITEDYNDPNKLNNDVQERIVIDLKDAYTLKATQTTSNSQNNK